MSDALPTSIENYLEEAGFSGTEIIVLKKLLEEDALTLRELAAKTGKSTGVLDQAVKKLMKKRILSRENINDIPKYILKSLQSVVSWMEDDMKTKQEMMIRRHENFESFIRSLTVGKKRPEMEYFEGADGMKKAYMELLNRGNDIVQYGPTLWLAEEDPLRDFRVQFFRERRKRGIFSRVITHNTPLGRRSQSRDPFEYRKTILVEQDAYPLNFERIVVGDTVACFQLEDERACFIRYPELAQSERLFFERLWNKKVANESRKVAADDEAEVKPLLPVIDAKISVPFKTKTFSQIRDFFLSPRSLIVLMACGILAAGVTYGLYYHNASLNLKRIQEKALSIAATGALQFSVEDLDKLRTLEDTHKPEYAKVIYQLNLIRNQNAGVKYAYIMRPKEDPEILEFVADADSLDPSAKKDLNNDGIINEKDWLSPPGESYELEEGMGSAIALAKGVPAFDEAPYSDQWGTFISGSAPIRDSQNNIVAVFSIDIEASAVNDLNQESFVPAIWFLALFILFVLIRLAAFNRSLLQGLFIILKVRSFYSALIGSAITAILLSGFIYYLNIQQNIERIREKVSSIAATGAIQFSAEDLNQLHSLQDVETATYKRVVQMLHNIRSQNEDIQYAYLIRPDKNSSTFEFIADADAFGINLSNSHDTNNDGIIDESDDVGYPGLQYDVSYIGPLISGQYFTPISTAEPYSDKWGAVFTGYAPIKDAIGNVKGILAIDVRAKEVYWPNLSVLIPIIIFAIGFLVYLIRRSTQ